MGYKQRARKVYEDCKPLIDELHDLKQWFDIEKQKEKERREQENVRLQQAKRKNS